ncbi:MAG: universal stress protein, partial [Desulfobulbaceae bacterium]|nr:universal stress protein [Desulfobulbaceae bacterium]
MDDVKKIMVPLTLTLDSEGLFNYAAQVAALLNAQLIVASIINSRDISAIGMVASLGYEVDGEHYVEGVKAEREKILEQFLGQSSFNRENVRTIIKVGNPV